MRFTCSKGENVRIKMYAYSYNFQLGRYFIFTLVSFDRYNWRVNACKCNYSRYMAAAAAEMCIFHPVVASVATLASVAVSVSDGVAEMCMIKM